MKVLIHNSLLFLIHTSFVSCSSKDLTRKKVLEVIKEHESGAWIRDTMTYYLIVDSSPLVDGFRKSTLEQEVFWRINSSLNGKNNVIFTDKAKPYLIEGIEKRNIGTSFRQHVVSCQQIITVYIEPEEVSGVKLEPGDRKVIVI